MILILSPSKTLAKIEIQPRIDPTQPDFLNKSEILINRLRELNVNDLKGLMGISQSLATLNFERFLKWQTPFTKQNSYPALLSFKGDVYAGIDVVDFSADDFLFAQQNLRILSGLYGVLRPLDLMQPYRLEMGTKVDVESSNNLYDFWRDTITRYFEGLIKLDKENTLVNLASNEYSKAINFNKIGGTIVTPVFKEQKGDSLKTIAIYAKRARGLMTRFVIKNKLEQAEHLKAFTDEGYVYAPDYSKGNNWVFIR
ncbi:MAG: peroxide stress protein YaaA [Tenuifilaceae bacterium]|nr:peroxide stress protein YaaA [Tenuifilaceae bacterium]